ncbi:hypothetical protein MPLA_340050 [Mesorhizobium sp. ORS 3359]|nr:hypothetical protein MPLA_340050 [Mesorhizobium sp. ORS 3359]
MWRVYDKLIENHENVVRLSGLFWTVRSLLQTKRGCMTPKALATVSYSDKILFKVVGFTETKGAALNSRSSRSVRRTMAESIS